MEAWVAWLMELFRSEHIEFALFAAAFISATVLPGDRKRCSPAPSQEPLLEWLSLCS